MSLFWSFIISLIITFYVLGFYLPDRTPEEENDSKES